MKGVFSGLRPSLGLGKLEKVDVFEDASENSRKLAKIGKSRAGRLLAEAELSFRQRRLHARYVIRSSIPKMVRTGKVKLIGCMTRICVRSTSIVDCSEI